MYRNFMWMLVNSCETNKNRKHFFDELTKTRNKESMQYITQPSV